MFKKFLIGFLIVLYSTSLFAKGNRQDDPSYQIEHDRTKGFSPTEHYTQEQIDRVSDTFNGINYHEFYINEDLGDVTSKLIFGRTTGGNAEISWDGVKYDYTKQNIILNGYTTLSRMYSGGDSVFGHNIYSDTASRVLKQLNDSYYSAWVRIYYNEGISFGGRNVAGSAGDIVNDPAGTTNEYMRLNLVGQLLIGTTSPVSTEKLRVNGNEYLDGELQIASTGKVISGSKALTDGSATGIFEVAIPSNTSAGGTMSYSIKCFDGTDLQNHSGLISFAGVNKGGTVTSDIDEVYLAASETKVTTAGTLSDTWTITDGAGKITINLNANTSLTPTSMVLYYTITLNGNEVVTKL